MFLRIGNGQDPCDEMYHFFMDLCACQVVHVGRQLPITVTLANLLEKSFPDEYEARRQETRSAAAGGSGEDVGEAPLPLFVMSCMMPGQHCFRLLLQMSLPINCSFDCIQEHDLIDSSTTSLS